VARGSGDFWGGAGEDRDALWGLSCTKGTSTVRYGTVRAPKQFAAAPLEDLYKLVDTGAEWLSVEL
jgi:hypothetical protein